MNSHHRNVPRALNEEDSKRLACPVNLSFSNYSESKSRRIHFTVVSHDLIKANEEIS